MKGKWIKKSLNECCDFFSGSGFPERFQGHKSGDYPFIKVSDMSLAGNSVFLANANNWVSREIATYLSAKIIPAGATAFAKIGAAMLLNRRRITVQGTCFDNNMMAAIPKETIDGRFIYYIFTTLDFADFSQVTALPSLNLSALKSYMIRLPKIKEDQQHIADILTSCDEVIEQTEKAIAKYRDIKAGMLQNLFSRGVDANGKLRPKPEDAPELYKDSPLGKIPKEWDDPQPLCTVLHELEAGVSVNAIDTISFSQIAVLKTSAVFNGRFFPQENKKVVDKDIPRVKTPVHKDSIIISRMNTPLLVGECGYVSHDYHFLFLPDRLWQTVFYPDAQIDVQWLTYLLITEKYKNRVKEQATGTSDTMKNIAKEVLFQLPIAFPLYKEQVAIRERLFSLDSKISREEQTLAKYRSIKLGLMKKLLTPPEGVLEA